MIAQLSGHCESIARDTIVDPEFTLLLEPLLRHIAGLCAARLDREPRHCRLQLLLHLLLRRLVLHLNLNPNAQSTAAAQLRVHLVANRSVQVASFALNSISIHRYDINIFISNVWNTRFTRGPGGQRAGPGPQNIVHYLNSSPCRINTAYLCLYLFGIRVCSRILIYL